MDHFINFFIAKRLLLKICWSLKNLGVKLPREKQIKIKKVYVGEWVNDIPKCGMYSVADFSEDFDPDTGQQIRRNPPAPFSYRTEKPLEIPEVFFFFFIKKKK